jgi:hypothetical protein
VEGRALVVGVVGEVRVRRVEDCRDPVETFEDMVLVGDRLLLVGILDSEGTVDVGNAGVRQDIHLPRNPAGQQPGAAGELLWFRPSCSYLCQIGSIKNIVIHFD